MNVLARLSVRLLDTLWPRRCVAPGCGRRSDRSGRHLCSACFGAMPFSSGPACRKCGRVFPADGQDAADFTCDICAKTLNAPVDRACHAVEYAEPAVYLIKTLKYSNGWWLAPDLADLLEGAVRARLPYPQIDMIAPVPLSPKRERERGYNQAWLLARELGTRFGRLAYAKALVRTRDTEHQARLSREARMTNLKGVFAAPHPAYVRGRTILLVDDVTTTGSTLGECAVALKAAGAAAVWAATVCRRD